MTERRTLEPVTRDDLRALLDGTMGPAISLYQPTSRAGKEAEGNPLRYKNLLAKAEEAVEALGGDRRANGRLLDPMRELVGDADLWSRPQDGLAVFRTPDEMRVIRLDYTVPEKVVVSKSIHVLPLLTALDGNRHFFVLALSMKNVRLLRASTHGFEEVDLSGIDMPHSLGEALRYDDFQKTELQQHPGSATGAAGGRHMFHGHGPGSEDQKNEIVRYFHAVSTGLREILATERAPLVLAGVDYLHALFRQASDYRNITQLGIEGNPDGLSAAQLHERSLPIVEPYRRDEINALCERCGSLLGTGRSSDDLTDILAAAHAGRVDALLVRAGESLWGTYDPAGEKPIVHEDPRPGDEDLLDLAVRQTLLHGGDAHLVDADVLPESTRVCANYRF